MQIELRCAQAIARAAGKKLIEERRQGFSVAVKAKDDLVTSVDHSIERFIRDELALVFPDDGVLGEEHGYGGEAQQHSTNSRQWLVDPIDGTLNFSSGLPLYCISIALQLDGRTQVGVVYDPVRDELFSAARGSGATLDNEVIHVSQEACLEDAMLVTGFPAKGVPEFEATLRQFDHLTRTTRSVRRLGTAAIDLAYVASGRLDGFWEYALSPWDTAAGYLLVEEAGGKVTDIEGAPYYAHSPSILASNGKIHQDLLQSLQNARS